LNEDRTGLSEFLTVGSTEEEASIGPRRTGQGMGFDVRAFFDGPIDSAIPDQVTEHPVATVREAVNNIGRHPGHRGDLWPWAEPLGQAMLARCQHDLTWPTAGDTADPFSGFA
jgi:hypothetical protein